MHCFGMLMIFALMSKQVAHHLVQDAVGQCALPFFAFQDLVNERNHRAIHSLLQRLSGCNNCR
jgi:hypothetical protein